MTHALIGAFVMIFAVSLLVGIPVWAYSMNMQARRPPSWVPPWKAAPSLIPSAICACLSVMWAYYFIDLSGPKSPFKLSFWTKFSWAYTHGSRQELFTICTIWLTLFGAALFVFVRSAVGFARPRVSPNGPTIREYFQRSHGFKRLLLTVCAVILAVIIKWRHQDLTRIQVDALMGVLLLPIFFALGLTPIGRVRCPRCGCDLKQLQSEQLGRMKRGTGKPWEVWESCPKCHVSFDEPYSSRHSSTPALGG